MLRLFFISYSLLTLSLTNSYICLHRAILVHFLYFVWDAKTISQRTARQLFVLHPKQNVESEHLSGKRVKFYGA